MTKEGHTRARAFVIAYRSRKVEAAVLCASILLGGLYPIHVRAWSLTDMMGVFRGTAEASVPTRPMSVQTLPLERPAMNYDPTAAKGGADVVIEDDVAVRAPGGFSGAIVKPKNDTISIHEVRAGETLSEIAQLYEVDVNTIVWANGLPSSGSSVRAGQILTILPVSGVKHTVKAGDTLQSIAKKYQGNVDEIVRFNGLSGQALAAGNEIIVPNGQEMPAPVKATAKTPAPASKPSPAYAGYYTNPLPGGIRTQGLHNTNAVDLAASIGTPIKASAAGQVIIAREGGYGQGYGSYIVIKHDNGTQTLYAHMSSVEAGVGQWVAQGEVIGRVGNTGLSTGPHLHFEIRGGPRNPF